MEPRHSKKAGGEPHMTASRWRVCYRRTAFATLLFGLCSCAIVVALERKPGQESNVGGRSWQQGVDINLAVHGVADEDEDTKGQVVQVNSDDDDGDAGSGPDPTPDMNDGVVVNGDNDLMELTITKLDAAKARPGYAVRLEYDSTYLALWKDKEKREPVISGTTEFALYPALDEDIRIWAEGRKPTGIGGQPVVLRLYTNHTARRNTDRVKLIVPEMVFVLVGHAASFNGSSLKTYLDAHTQDGRTDPYIVKGKALGGTVDCYYSVYIWNTPALAQIAMSSLDSTVVFNGHSNFGLGLSFTSGNTSIAAFVNVAEDLVPINWPYLRAHGHPNLMIEDGEYGNDTTTPEPFDPVVSPCVVHGELSDYQSTRFTSTPVPGIMYRCSLCRGSDKPHDYHTSAAENPSPPDPDDTEIRLVVKSGSADMPTKRWKRIYLASCFSGLYYYPTFNHGTFFYTTDELYLLPDGDCPREFVKAVIGGKDNTGILQAINATSEGTKSDYHHF